MSSPIRVVPIAFLLAAIAGLSGCAATGRSVFVQSKAPDAATIQARRVYESLRVWEGYSLLAVDDKFVSVGFFRNPNTATTKVDAGSRRLVIRGAFGRGFPTETFEAFVPLDVDLKPYAYYEINGNISGPAVEVWLEDRSSRQRVTEVGTASYSRQPPAPAPVFIFIPTHHR
jgi:hypothetical protein